LFTASTASAKPEENWTLVTCIALQGSAKFFQILLTVLLVRVGGCKERDGEREHLGMRHLEQAEGKPYEHPHLGSSLHWLHRWILVQGAEMTASKKVISSPHSPGQHICLQKAAWKIFISTNTEYCIL
jgi:hypothetical protein